MSGRVVLVAGASSGLGAGFARLFARAGARVVLGARRTDRLEALADELRCDGGEALAVPLDVTDEASVAAAFDLAEAQYGVVDSVVANAGTAAGGRATDIAANDVRRVVDTNLLGVYLVTREAARRLIAGGSRERGNGRIVLVGSITAEQAGTGDAAYAATKAAVAHLGRQFAKEWVRQGVNVNTIQPGWILTDFNREWFASDLGKEQIQGLHRRRLQSEESLHDMVLYLASDASAMVTGATFTLDDGQSL